MPEFEGQCWFCVIEASVFACLRGYLFVMNNTGIIPRIVMSLLMYVLDVEGRVKWTDHLLYNYEIDRLFVIP